MMKKLLLTILAIYVVTHTTGCSSSSPKEESEVAATEDEAFAEEGEEDFADAEKAEESSEGEEVAEESAEGEEAAEGEEVAEEKPVEKAEEGEEEFAEAEEGEAEKTDESQKTEVAATAEEDEDTSEFPEEAPEETQTAAAEQPSDENLFTADNKDASPSDTAPPASAPEEDQSVASAPVIDETPAASEQYAEAPVYRPLQKIKDTPFDKNGVLMNRVYVARAGDTYKAAAEKIYGSADRSSDLKKWNGASRNSLKVGEKVYYNSPREPQDSTRVLTYYEDAGLQPQLHVTQDGDNIRELGKSLLGDPNGWKELWATNLDVESKGALPPGVQLKYWPDASVPAQTVAQAPTETAPPPTDMSAPPPSTDVAQNPTGTTDPMAVPPTDMGAPPAPTGDVAQTDPMAQTTPDMAPPPVAGTNEAPPPPPPVDQEPVQKKAPATAEAPEEDMTTTMGIAGLGLVGLAVLFIMMKKNRARRIDLSQTQV